MLQIQGKDVIFFNRIIEDVGPYWIVGGNIL